MKISLFFEIRSRMALLWFQMVPNGSKISNSMKNFEWKRINRQKYIKRTAAFTWQCIFYPSRIVNIHTKRTRKRSYYDIDMIEISIIFLMRTEICLRALTIHVCYCYVVRVLFAIRFGSVPVVFFLGFSILIFLWENPTRIVCLLIWFE